MDEKFLDALAIVSFLVGLQNLEMNITQEDMQNTEANLDRSLRKNVTDLHKHLEEQDKKINAILDILKENGGVIYVGR